MKKKNINQKNINQKNINQKNIKKYIGIISQTKLLILVLISLSSFLLYGCGNEPTMNVKQESEIEILSEEQSEGNEISFPESGQNLEEKLETEIIQNENSSQIADLCYVHISGAVKYPGVYELTSGSRLYQVVELAGGFLEDASQDYCNLAMNVYDGQHYYIPTKTEVANIDLASEINSGSMNNGIYSGENIDSHTAGNYSNSSYTEDGKLDINQANVEEFQTLTGIGETRAKAIVAYREENGLFRCTEDIMLVPGIKEGTYNLFKEQITVR